MAGAQDVYEFHECAVESWNAEDNVFMVRVLSNDMRKPVKRLNLIFAAEDRAAHDAMVVGAKARREEAEAAYRYWLYIDSQDAGDVVPTYDFHYALEMMLSRSAGMTSEIVQRHGEALVLEHEAAYVRSIKVSSACAFQPWLRRLCRGAGRLLVAGCLTCGETCAYSRPPSWSTSGCTPRRRAACASCACRRARRSRWRPRSACCPSRWTTARRSTRSWTPWSGPTGRCSCPCPRSAAMQSALRPPARPIATHRSAMAPGATSRVAFCALC